MKRTPAGLPCSARPTSRRARARAYALRSLAGGALAAGAALTSAGPASAASTIAVNTTADAAPAAGECGGAAGDCSLRQALDRAHSGDTVLVPAGSSSYVIREGKIGVRGGVTIRGAGDALTTIDGAGADQAFELLGGGPVTIAGMTITRTANTSAEDEAGAINGAPKTEDPLTLEDVAITESTTHGGFGGAIETGGELTVRHSRFEGDTVTSPAAKSAGGAIDVFGGASLTISDSVFALDSTEKGPGGAVAVENKGSLAVTASTFYGDIAGAGRSGGAIELFPATHASIADSTFTADAAGSGGAVNGEGESLALLGDTLAGNAAEIGANLAVPAKTTGVSVENTIFATPSGNGANCNGQVTSAGHNLEDAPTSSCGLSAGAGDLIGVSPGLQALALNSSTVPTAGGPPPTLAVPASSPAHGAGATAGCEALGSVDERGFPRPGVIGAGCDIGAYELLPTLGTSLALGASSRELTVGTPLTLSASVALAPTRSLPAAVPGAAGSVEFASGGVDLGTVPLSPGGQAVLTTAALAAGSHAIIATYSGDGLRSGATSAATTVTVLPPLPALSAVSESQRRWREGSWRAALARRRAHRPPLGTTFAFTLNTTAEVKLTFTYTVPGRRARGRCVASRPRNRRARRCTRTLTAGVLTFANVRAGAHRVAFAGRISRRAKLRPGRYLVTVAAFNAAGHATARALAFTIAR